MKTFFLILTSLLVMVSRAFCNYVDDGDLKLKTGDYNGAISDYTKAIAIKPNYTIAYNNRGIAKKLKGDLDGAVADYTKAIELKPDNVSAYYNRGIAEKTKKDYKGALSDFKKTLELQPGDVQSKAKIEELERITRR